MTYHFLDSGPLSGPDNMRVDAELLAATSAGSAAFVRVYAWAKPTLSLGYFQSLEDVAQAAGVAAYGVDVVKRATGGGAILHQHEITLSLALPASHPWARMDVNACYLKLTQPLVDVLKGLGAKAEFRGEADKLKTPNCFAGRACPDVVIEGKKVFGSAQRRKDAGVLQHGSLLLDIDRALWASVFGPNLGEGFTSLAEHGLRPGYAVLAEALKKAYAQALGVEFSPWQGQAEIAPAA